MTHCSYLNQCSKHYVFCYQEFRHVLFLQNGMSGKVRFRNKVITTLHIDCQRDSAKKALWVLSQGKILHFPKGKIYGWYSWRDKNSMRPLHRIYSEFFHQKMRFAPSWTKQRVCLLNCIDHLRFMDILGDPTETQRYLHIVFVPVHWVQDLLPLQVPDNMKQWSSAVRQSHKDNCPWNLTFKGSPCCEG